MDLDAFFKKLSSEPETVDFTDTMSIIDEHYEFEETTFSNSGLVNEAGQNSGSCKIFAFAREHGLSEDATLALFGKYYREDVLSNPGGDDHQNIRNFMKTGWEGITFAGKPLAAK